MSAAHDPTSIEIGGRYALHPVDCDGFGLPPSYLARAGTMVAVVGLTPGDDGLLGARDTYQVVAEDGWIGAAFREELIDQVRQGKDVASPLAQEERE